MSVEQLKTSDFEKSVANNSGLVVVDFSAVWCGPCQMLAPVFEKIAEKYADTVKFFQVDVDEEQDLAIQFKVQGVPTLVFFKDGKEVERHTGLIQEINLDEKIQALNK